MTLTTLTRDQLLAKSGVLLIVDQIQPPSGPVAKGGVPVLKPRELGLFIAVNDDGQDLPDLLPVSMPVILPDSLPVFSPGLSPVLSPVLLLDLLSGLPSAPPVRRARRSASSGRAWRGSRRFAASLAARSARSVTCALSA